MDPRDVRRPSLAVQDFAGQSRHTTVSLTAGQRRFVTVLVEGVVDIAGRDPNAVRAGVAAGRALIADPTRVRAMLRKAFTAPKQAANPVSKEEKERRVLDLLHRGDGLTTTDVVNALGPDLTKALALATLNGLVRAGQVIGERQPDGPYNRWYLVPPVE
jgi:hypothetical protein